MEKRPVDFARDYLEDFLTFFGLNTSVEAAESEGVIELNIPSTHLNGFLIGQRGDNLRAIQYLLNQAMRNAGFEDIMATVDVAGYKAQRARRLGSQVKEQAEGVLTSGEDKELRPMSAYERRVVHQAIGEVEGVTSQSTGEGRDRRVVIKKTGEPQATAADEEE